MNIILTGALSVKELLSNSILESGLFQTELTAEYLIKVCIALLIALVIGALICLIYKLTCRGVIYPKSFPLMLVGITVLTGMATLAVSTNIILALVMVGALSIVRFKAAVKEPFDLLFLFWAITSGVAIGAAMYILTFVGAAIMVLLLLIVNTRKVSGHMFIMLVRYTGDDISDSIKRIMKNKHYEIKAKTMRGDTIELAVEVFVRSKNLAFVEQIKELESVTELSMVQYNGEYHD